MLKTLLGQVREYKRASLLAPLFTGLEVLMEVLIPFVTASIIDKGIEAGNIRQVYLYGGLMLVMAKTTRVFNQVFQKYDDLNASVQENVSAIRVVKAFVREDHESRKFRKAAEKLYRLFVKAEGRLAFNNPVMMLVVYGCILALSWFGAQFIVAGNLTTGELTSLFSYVMSVLMSLMMVSMVFVMITMSAASGRRIAEVLPSDSASTSLFHSSSCALSIGLKCPLFPKIGEQRPDITIR